MRKICRLLTLALCLLTNVYASEKSAPQASFPYIPNLGQWPGNHQFEAAFGGFRAFIGSNETRLVLFNEEKIHEELHLSKAGKADLHALLLDFPGSQPGKLQAYEAGITRQHYYLGNKRQWRSNVPAYARVSQPELYPGIELLWQQEEGNLKFDFIVKAGADPDQIRVRYRGADRLELKNGRLHLQTSLGEMIEMAPLAWSETSFGRIPVTCRFELEGGLLRFFFPEGYDKDYTLVIDPVLIFATYSGSGARNFGFTATPDQQGNFYSAGTVFNVGFPTTAGAYQEDFVGNTVDGNAGLRVDIGILKFSVDGTQLLYATYLGGRRDEQPHSLNVNSNNELVMLGSTRSDNFPVTANAYDTSFNGNYDLVISRLSPDGSQLLGSTYLGGSQNDGINSLIPLRYRYADDYRGDLQITPDNEVVIASLTNSPLLPTTAGSAQPLFGGGFCDGLAARLSEDLSTLRWMTYLGGSDADALYGACISDTRLLVVGGTLSNNLPASADAHQDSLAGGADGILATLNLADGSLNKMTYLGSAGYDQLFFVDTDDDGLIYVNGQTDSNIVTRGTNYNDLHSGQYVARFSPNLDSLHWLGRYGSGNKVPDMSPSAFLVDICKNIYVSGWTGIIDQNPNVPGPTDLTLTNNAIQTTSDGYDFYLAAFSENMLTMSFSTYFGGATSPDHVDGGTSRFDPRGVIYQAICAGCAANDLPTSPGSWSPNRGVADCNNAGLKIAFELETGIKANFGWVDPPTWCRPVDLQIQNISRVDPTVTYSWVTSDGQTSIQTNPQFIFTEPGIYSIRLEITSTIACNQRDTLTRFVEIRDQPDLQLPPDTCICESDELILQANVPGDIFNWTGPDGTSNGATFEATSTGRYTLQLTDMYGCEDTDSMEIVVSECFGKIPNVITPNGDGANDVLQPLNQQQPEYEMQIFNRWGQLVFRTTDALEGWKGLNQQTGKLVEGGDYVVRLKANFCGTQLLEKTLQLHVAY